MFSLLLKDLISDFIFDFTAAGVVPCGGRKTSPRTFWFILVFESTAYLRFAKLQYVSSGRVTDEALLAETT